MNEFDSGLAAGVLITLALLAIGELLYHTVTRRGRAERRNRGLTT